MAPGNSHSRFTHPIDSERPKGASRFEFFAPKLKRRVTLFDPFHVRLWALLESIPGCFVIASTQRTGVMPTVGNCSIFG